MDQRREMTVEERMSQLMAPVEQQLMMCDDHKDQLMMACAMLQRVRELFDFHLGVEGRREMFKDLV
jgi:hypothetical protein